jgi:predicted transposase YbfD/YdcC
MCRATRTLHGETSTEDRYFITSTTHNDVEIIAHGARAHWGIENGLHWLLDVVDFLVRLPWPWSMKPCMGL